MNLSFDDDGDLFGDDGRDALMQLRRTLGARMHETVLEAAERVAKERDYYKQEIDESPGEVAARRAGQA